ncbi:MAG: APC family permease [Actinomycetes bacterium]
MAAPDRSNVTTSAGGTVPTTDGLEANALRRGDVVIMALASSGPTQSIAVSLAAIVAAVSYAGIVPIFICLIPMLGIAIGYRRLNAWQPDAGATFSWVGRALSPSAGFLSGWLMLLYYVVGTISLTVPLGTYTLSLFSQSLPNNNLAVAITGTLLDLVVLAVAAIGIQASARFQWSWAVFEYVVLIAFAILALVRVYVGHLAGSVHVSASWFTVSGAGGFHALIGGILIAIFLYSGWDTAAYVGEETRDRRAGDAALLSVVLLFLIYSLGVFAFQGVVPDKTLQANSGNILSEIGQVLGGGFWAKVMIIVVLGGTLASLQAAILSSSRIGFAMGRERVLPSWLARTHQRWRTPITATVLFGLLNVVFLWASLQITSIGGALSDIVSTLGLFAAIFYALTAAAAVWYYRRVIRRDATTLVIGGVLPALGAAFMAFVVVYSLATHVLNGVELATGVGLVVVGILAAGASRVVGRSAFFTGPRQVFAEPAADAGRTRP